MLRHEVYIPPRKLSGYLLNLGHSDGGPKAQYFRAHGYNESNAEVLRAGLLEIVATETISSQRETPFGMSVVVIGEPDTPRGTTVRIRTVWFLDTDSTRMRFVTAYPE